MSKLEYPGERPDVITEEDSDEPNLWIRAGYLRGMAERSQGDDRVVLLRACRSLKAYASLRAAETSPGSGGRQTPSEAGGARVLPLARHSGTPGSARAKGLIPEHPPLPSQPSPVSEANPPCAGGRHVGPFAPAVVCAACGKTMVPRPS